MQHWAQNSLFDGLFKFAAGFDCAPEEICAAIGLDRDQATAVGGLVPAARIIDAVEWCAARSGYADFGLQFAARTDPRITGLAALAAEQCRSLGDYYDLVRKNLPLHNTGYTFTLAGEADGAAARLVVHARGAFPARHYVEGVLAIQSQWFARLFGAGWTPRGVEFAHERLAAPAAYEAAFGAPVTFNTGRSALLFSAEDLAWRSERPYYKARPAFEAHLREMTLIETLDHAAHVAQLVRAVLPAEVKLEDVAAELGMSPRSLQRKLSGQATSFTAILTRTRLDLAREYLRSPGAKVAEVAARLGFAHVSELSRLLRQKLGAAPSAFRAEKAARQDR